MRPIPKSQENHYGGVRRHHPEHDAHILENFTDDNQDFFPNSSEYNDQEELRFNAENRLATEPHAKGPNRYHPSNYSDGGHGLSATTSETPENADNKDYPMNKDSAQGAKRKYENTEEKTKHHWWNFFRK